MKKTGLILIAVLFFAFTGVGSGMAATFRQMVAFGDSLSDSGNIIRATAAQSGSELTAGKVWAEHLADFLDAGLMNYAHAGATCGDDDTPPFGLNKQVADFVTAFENYPSFDYANTLFSVWIGGNDFLDALDSADPSTVIATVVQNISTAIETLANAGVQHLVVFNLPDLGLTPRVNSDATISAMARLASSAFNSGLADALAAFSSTYPEVTVYEVDAFSIMDAMVADPSAYGFDNVSDALTDGDSTILGDMSLSYLFVDGIHPTSAGHAVIAEFVAQEISGTGPAWYADGYLQLPNVTVGQTSLNCTMEQVLPVPEGVDGLVFHTTECSPN